MLVLSSEEAKTADTIAIKQFGIPSIVLMENAARGASRIIIDKYPLDIYENVLIIAGKGNNGGDGIAVARILSGYGYSVNLALLTDENSLNEDPKINLKIYKNIVGDYLHITNPNQISELINNFNPKSGLIIDAIFGIGINKPVNNEFYTGIFNIINNSKFKIISIDIPSGLSEKFLPEKYKVIKADTTISFQSIKTSLIHPDGNNFCGETYIVDIGIPDIALTDISPKHLIEYDDISFLHNTRASSSHKGVFGHCLNISGSKDKPGAAILSSKSILKSGAGLCTVAVTEKNRDVIINSMPELMCMIYKQPNELVNVIENAGVILSGPGMGVDNTSHEILKLILKNSNCPLVFDADALNIISKNPTLLDMESKTIILTPHLGEFSRLTGISKNKILNNRVKYAIEFSKKHNLYLILKGHHTIISSPAGEVFINQTGNAGMATAGSGDVLSGIIAGFISQYQSSTNLLKILTASVFIHGYAGDLATETKGEISMTASDIVDNISNAILRSDDFKSKFRIR